MPVDRQPKPADLIALMEEFRSRFAALGSAIPGEEAIRADERRKVAEEIRDLADWKLSGGFVNIFAFNERHPDRGLDELSTPILSAFLRMLADEIENGDRRE